MKFQITYLNKIDKLDKNLLKEIIIIKMMPIIKMVIKISIEIIE